MKYVFTAVAALLTCTVLFAQKNTTTTFKNIKEQCKNIPAEQRVRITVARFSVTTTASMEFGGNLATMLTNALQNVNCYRVMESLINKQDMNGEIDYGEGAYVRKSSAQIGTQYELTGYEQPDNLIAANTFNE